MTTLKNDRFLRALLREPVDTTPVWMMRQAGRYLPEYRETRAQAGDFLSLCKNTEFACEVTLQPLRRYELDAAILFSDILTVPDALGLGLYFETGEGPKFHKTIRTEQDVANLPKFDAKSDLAYVMRAVSTIRSAYGATLCSVNATVRQYRSSVICICQRSCNGTHRKTSGISALTQRQGKDQASISSRPGSAHRVWNAPGWSTRW